MRKINKIGKKSKNGKRQINDKKKKNKNSNQVKLVMLIEICKKYMF